MVPHGLSVLLLYSPLFVFRTLVPLVGRIGVLSEIGVRRLGELTNELDEKVFILSDWLAEGLAIGCLAWRMFGWILELGILTDLVFRLALMA